MNIEQHYKPELCASKDAARVPIYNVVSIDATDALKPRAIATDGKMMAVVPVTIDGDDVLHEGTALIPTESLKSARKMTTRKRPAYIGINETSVGTSVGAGRVCTTKLVDSTTTSYPRDYQFPRWREVVEGISPKEGVSTMKLALNPKLLLACAEAIGAGCSVTIEIPMDGNKVDHQAPVRITGDHPDAFAILMQIRTQ